MIINKMRGEINISTLKMLNFLNEVGCNSNNFINTFTNLPSSKLAWLFLNKIKDLKDNYLVMKCAVKAEHPEKLDKFKQLFRGIIEKIFAIVFNLNNVKLNLNKSHLTSIILHLRKPITASTISKISNQVQIFFEKYKEEIQQEETVVNYLIPDISQYVKVIKVLN